MANNFCQAGAISIVTLMTVVSPTLADQPTQKNQGGAEILEKGGPIEDKYVPTQQPGPNYPADDKLLQQDAEKAKTQGTEDMLRRGQDDALAEDYDDETGIVSWPEDYWYWPYSLYPY